ncbi:MAG TPA: hypothetical protein VFO38_02695 [Candidatus Saccharimonadales bacterium]|nr:hypothetical protein [Candidatus Saccharimonadales bacterium]
MTIKQIFLLATPLASDRLRKLTGYTYVVKSKWLATLVIVCTLIGFTLIPPIIRDFAIGDFVNVAVGIGGFLITAAVFAAWFVTRIAIWVVEHAKRRGEIVELDIVFVLGFRYLLESRKDAPNYMTICMWASSSKEAYDSFMSTYSIWQQMAAHDPLQALTHVAATLETLYAENP